MSWRPLRWLDAPAVELVREGGALTLILAGERTPALVPVHAFPHSATQRAVALVDASGEVVAMLDSPDALPPDSARALSETLADRTFEPEIEEVLALAYRDAVHHWTVRTSAGDRTFTTRQRWNALPVVRLPSGACLILGDDGVRYRIRDPAALSARSRRLLFPVL